MKKILVVDMTHGGVIIASELSEKYDGEVRAWDIYHTLDRDVENILTDKQITMVDDDFIQNNKDFMVVAPAHCRLDVPVSMTHHQAVGMLLENEIDVPVIEVTGVKGKTSTVAILKEIYKHQNPLILSSLGVEAVENNKVTLLMENISITPANILKSWKTALKYFKPGICIFETSLGGTGLADVGVLTNLVEDYSIAQGTKRASEVKKQIFDSKMVVCEYNAFISKYPHFYSKTNTFSFFDQRANISVSEIEYGINETKFTLKVSGLKTINGDVINTSFEVKTFAPGPYHVENVLSAIGTAFTLETSQSDIIMGISNFNGLKGRTSIIENGNVRIVQEINPGINLTAVKKSVSMMREYGDMVLVMGGQYGVTCEEIDEKLLSEFLENMGEDIFLILTDELGKSIESKIARQKLYKKDLKDAMVAAQDLSRENILLIYRSHFANLQKR
ncbi:MAG TPA: coenzyme F430 synthase [Methanobacteriaceae archaeon]|nr:coenzyme F430 synthase [Methanobacteriaceae archaeon]